MQKESGASRQRYARFIGIDPGASGGIAVLHHTGAVEVAVPMPESDAAMLLLLHAHRAFARAVMERVHSSPQMGVVSAFSFGHGVGGLRMALLACKVPFEEVTSGTWQKALGLYVPHRQKAGAEEFSAESDRVRSNAASREKKQMHKERAQALFPVVKVTHALADALLIAEYARRSAA